MKRDRGDEEDLNDTEVKKIIQSNDIIILNQVYNRLSIQEREAFFRNIFEKDVIFKRFYGIPEDLLRIIAKMTPGTLMKLARTMDTFFIRLARDDRIWQEMFRRDFPKDYEFCRGVLPFYVLEPTHPFYTPGSVSKDDLSPWKRYYLHIAKRYQDLTVSVGLLFINNEEIIPGDFDFDSSKSQPKSREFYRWIHQFVLPKRYDSFDWRSTLAWTFIGAFVWYVTPDDYKILESADVAKTMYIYSKDRPWMILYLICMYSNHDKGIDYIGLEEEDIPIHGPRLSEKSLKEINSLFPLASVDRNAIFSKEDRGRLESFISTRINSTRLDTGYANTEVRTERGKKLLQIWDFLADCYSIPCIFSLEMVFGEIGKVYMARESTQIRERIQNLIAENPIEILNLDMSNTIPIFSRPGLQIQAVNIMNLWYPIQQSDIFTANRPGEETNTSLDSFFVNAYFPKYIFRVYSATPRKGSGRIAYSETCIQCGIVPALPQQCSGTCERTVYCGVECQRAHWLLGHQKECRIK